MSEPFIRYSVDADGIAWLLWNRPAEKNALLPEMTDEACRRLDEAAADEKVRCLVLSGEGEAFSAGADLKRLAEPGRVGRNALEGHARGQHGTAGVRKVLGFPKPTIAAVHGPAAGMACAWALACDIVVAAPDARFHFSFLRVGFVTDCGTSWLLVRRVGIGQAKKIVLTSDPVSGADAVRIGLADELAEASSDLQRAGEIARRIGERAPLAVREARRILEFARTSSFDEAAELEGWVQGALGETEDHKEALRAFSEKRPPRFQGR